MPELPEVEAFKNFFSRTSLNQKVSRILFSDQSMLEGIQGKHFEQKIEGFAFTECLRHGKYLFAKNNGDVFMVMHFGMTGSLMYREKSEKPRYYKMALEFDRGCLYYLSIRKLGKLSLTESIEDYKKQKRLGPDALQIGEGDFLKLASAKKGMVKTVFMDQSFVAGLGNIYADEICFQAAVRPRKKVHDCQRKEIKKLYRCMQHVLQTAIAAEADISRMPSLWLIRRREAGKPCPRCGKKITRMVLQGRGTYFCAHCQK